MTDKTENRGGKRAGAGRKPTVVGTNIGLTNTQVKKMLNAARKVEKKTGVSLDEILVMIAYDRTAKHADRLAAIKLFKDCTMVKVTENNVNVTKQIGPQIGLPDLDPLPDNVIAIQKASE